MSDICTIREAVGRAKRDRIPLSEYALRELIKKGAIPVRYVGKRKALVSYAVLVEYFDYGRSATNIKEVS